MFPAEFRALTMFSRCWPESHFPVPKAAERLESGRAGEISAARRKPCSLFLSFLVPATFWFCFQDVGWKSAICPEYCPNLYEDMQTVADMLQHDVGRDMRLHNSTFLWFIPFVHSVMDLREGVAYNGEVIHHLCAEVREDHCAAFRYVDKVSQFFMWILVSVVELHHNKGCLHLLWITSSTWVEAVVNGATLPSSAFLHGAERSARGHPRAAATALSQGCESIQSACMKLIRSLLKEGYQLGQKASCEPFLNKLNVLVRCGASRHEGWSLAPRERRDLQACLKQVVRSFKEKRSLSSGENSGGPAASPTLPPKPEKGLLENRSPATVGCEAPSALGRSGQEGPMPPSAGAQETCKEAACRVQLCRNLCRASGCLLMHIKQEPGAGSMQDSKPGSCSMLAGEQKGAQENSHPAERGPSKPRAPFPCCSDQGTPNLKPGEASEEEDGLGASKRPAAAEKSPDARNAYGHLEVDQIRIKLEQPSLLVKLRETVKRRSTQLGAVEEKQPSEKGGSEGQKAGDSGAGRSPLTLLRPKAEESPDCAVRAADRPAELRGAVTGDEDLQDSDEDNVPFATILQNRKSRGSAAAASPATDSQVDRDLGRLSLAAYANAVNFPVDSSQESIVPCQNPIKRKVQGVARSLPADRSPDADKPTDQVITISDSEDDENEEPVKEKAAVGLGKPPSKARERAQEQATASNSPLPYEECASQFFEFETEDDIYSAWQDTQVEGKEEEPPRPSVKADGARKLEAEPQMSFEAAQQMNDWGYETDYLGAEVIEKAAEALEQQVKYGTTEKHQAEASKGGEALAKRRSSTDKETVRKRSASHSAYFAGARGKDGDHSRRKDSVRPSASTSSAQESVLREKLAKSREAKATPSSKQRSLTPSASHTKPLPAAKPVRSDSTEAPPRKDHHDHQQSTAEKPAQKTTSQTVFGPSPDSVATSRSCGKPPGEPRPPEKKAKLIPAQTLVSKNRKMLACQERPSPQSKVEKLGLKKPPRKALELSQRSLDNVAQLRSYGKAVGDLGLPQQKAHVRAGKSRKMLACQGLWPRHLGSRRSQEEQPAHRAAKGARKAPPKPGLQSPPERKEGAELVNGSSGAGRKPLKQSSLEEEEEEIPEPPLTRRGSPGPDPSVRDSPAPAPVLAGTMPSSAADGTNLDAADVAKPPARDPGEGPSNLNGGVEEDEDLFLTQREAVDMELCSQGGGDIQVEVDAPPPGPFSPGTFSHAGAVEEVSPAGAPFREHPAPAPSDHVFAKPPAPARPPTAKLFSCSSSRNANLAKELGSSSKGPLARTVPSLPASKPDGFRSQTPTFSSILRPQNSNHAPQPWSYPPSHLPVAVPERAAPRGAYARPPARAPSPEAPSGSVQQRDFKMFVKEILKWSYGMFASFSQTGPPDYFRQAIVGPVPLAFQDYNDYFNTFFPLMMLNAFETVGGQSFVFEAFFPP